MRLPTRAALAALLAALGLCLALGAADAGAGALQPPGTKIYFGISDTGDSADFGGFSKLLSNADFRQTSAGSVETMRSGTTTIRVGYRPVMVSSPS